MLKFGQFTLTIFRPESEANREKDWMILAQKPAKKGQRVHPALKYGLENADK